MLSPLIFPMNREVAEISPEMPSRITKDRQESSGKATLMREAFMERPSIAMPEISTFPPHAAERSDCRRLVNSSVLNDVSRYMYVPARAPTASRTAMQRAIRKRLFFSTACLASLRSS